MRAGVVNRRGDDGPAKVNRDYILVLVKAVQGNPLGYEYPDLPTYLGGITESCGWTDRESGVSLRF